MWPAPVDEPVADGLADVIAWLHAHGVPTWFGYRAIEASANVLMFVPFGVLLALLLPSRLRVLAVAVPVGLSLGVELAQAVWLPRRVATGWDVLMNSTGAALGAAVVSLAAGRRPRGRRRPRPSPARPPAART